MSLSSLRQLIYSYFKEGTTVLSVNKFEGGYNCNHPPPLYTGFLTIPLLQIKLVYVVKSELSVNKND